VASGAPAAEAQRSSAQTHAGALQQFPEGFLWGTATASYQVEGAVHEDGRGQSIWDVFSHTPGKTHDGDTGDVADDFYHRYPADIAMMKSMGVKSFRFSVAWTRIFPEGTGTPNQRGIDFYKRLVDALLAAGIAPYCTLYHWDLPEALQQKGGWQSKATAEAFGVYAGYVAGQLSDRVKHFMTMNELSSFIELGYGNGLHAPGLRLDRKALAQARHWAVYGHGLGVQAVRAHGRQGTEVGIADSITNVIPILDDADHIAAAKKALREENAMYQNVLQTGQYTDLYLKKLGADAPVFTAEELKVISSPMDFVGLNIYGASWVRPDDSEAGYAVVQNPQSYPHMYSDWLNITPEGLYWGPRLSHETWGIQKLYITENGASSSDTVAGDGQVYDTDRVMFLQSYLTQLQRAVSQGIPVRGYFLWSLMDNFEWADGYGKRFGITYVDFKTQQRIPKLSSRMYSQIIARNSAI
jgi:beta-glucosidase